jgi:hypothetical protein
MTLPEKRVYQLTMNDVEDLCNQLSKVVLQQQ